MEGPINNKIHQLTPGNLKKDVQRVFPTFVTSGQIISIVLILFAGFGALYYSGRLGQNENRVEDTYRILNKVDSVRDLLNEIAIAKSRYENTGNIYYLKAYQSNTIYLRAAVNSLKAGFKDHPAQRESVSKLCSNVSDLLKFWQSYGFFDNNVTLSPTQIAAVEKTKMDAANARIDSIKLTGQRLLKAVEKEEGRLMARTELAIVTGIGLILIICSFLTWFIRKDLKNSASAQQKEINDLKNNFISIASHEFRTPLSSMLLSLSLIERYARNGDSADILKHCQKIRNSMNNLTGILEDFLSLEKLNAGRIRAISEQFDLDEFCGSIVEDMESIVKQDQQLNYKAAGPGCIVRLDKNLLRNAVVNLVTNALKYAGNNATVTLESKIINQRVIVRVRDNGAGIPQESQEKLFSPFYRVNTTGNIPGSGLGLTIVLRYVKLMKGSLSVYSVPGKDTCFEMSFSGEK